MASTIPSPARSTGISPTFGANSSAGIGSSGVSTVIGWVARSAIDS